MCGVVCSELGEGGEEGWLALGHSAPDTAWIIMNIKQKFCCTILTGEYYFSAEADERKGFMD